MNVQSGCVRFESNAPTCVAYQLLGVKRLADCIEDLLLLGGRVDIAVTVLQVSASKQAFNDTRNNLFRVHELAVDGDFEIATHLLGRLECEVDLFAAIFLLYRLADLLRLRQVASSTAASARQMQASWKTLNTPV